ncbi:MAG: ribonuclease catalytic domain-containing protein [Elainellaceae cyanobacterium]
MEKGTLVEFRYQGDRRLGVAERPEGKKNWVVVDQRGQSYTVQPRQVTYSISGQYLPSELPDFLRQVETHSDPSGLEVIWELLSADGESVNPAELSDLLFSSDRPALCYAAHVLLSGDKVYFKQKGDRYEPRSAAQVADIRHQMEMEAKRAAEWEAFLGRINHRLGQGANLQELGEARAEDWQASDRPRIEALERLAVVGDGASHIAPALDILEALGRPKTGQSAFELLVDLGVWSRHENLFLRQRQIPAQFPQEVLAMASSCLENPIADADADHRLDLTHLKVSTVDDESTREIDDGLSIESLDDGRARLWIHIADPTRWISPGDELDLEARRRSTSVYLPTGTIPMFPTELATGPMSLVQGKVCYALSFGIVLDNSGAIEDYRISPSLIRPTYRLTYDDVDEILQLQVEAEQEIRAIADWADIRHQWRLSQGAINIRMPEATIKVKGDEVTISLLEDSKARQMVAEMMILTGEVAGRYAQTSGLTVPFRGQTQPELPDDDELLLLPAGPVRDCAIRRCMPRSEVNTSPLRHASLGLETYTQSTSPIRRYTDLLTHFQIKAHLRGDSLPFASETLMELVQSVTSTAYEATLVERQTNRYWSLEYLRRHEGEVWQVLMLRWLREHESLALVLLEELGLEVAVRLQRSVELGERFDLRVTYADPRQDVIQVAELSESVV